MKIPFPFLVALAALSLPPVCRVEAQVAASSPPLPQSRLLEKDKRLAVEISAPDDISSGHSRRTRVGRLLGWVDKRTRVQLNADDENINESYIFATFDKVKASDLLDGVAALWLARWEKNTPNSYRLLGRGSEVSDVFGAKDDNTREKYAAGVELMEGLAAMPKSGVAQDLRAGKTINVNDLPPALQGSLIGVITASDKAIAALGGKSKFPIHKLAQATLTARIKQHTGGFSSWHLKVAIDEWGDMGTLITDYDHKMKKRPQNANDAIYTPVKFAITQKQARALPELRRKIRLSMSKATAVEALQVLHKQYGVDIVSDAPEFMKERADIAINADTLADAFDALVKTFPNTEWEYRPSKFFIFRGPMNPAIRASN